MKAAVSGALIILLSAIASAHHSHPEFLMDQDATVRGTIERIRFADPHVVMTLRTQERTPPIRRVDVDVPSAIIPL